jgi:hypothetical protein
MIEGDRDAAKLSHTFLDGTRIEALFWDVKTGRVTDDPLDADGVKVWVYDKRGTVVVAAEERKAKGVMPDWYWVKHDGTHEGAHR